MEGGARAGRCTACSVHRGTGIWRVNWPAFAKYASARASSIAMAMRPRIRGPGLLWRDQSRALEEVVRQGPGDDLVAGRRPVGVLPEIEHPAGACGLAQRGA